MGRKPKYTFEAKIKVVQEYLNGKSSISTTAKQLNANENTIRQWVAIYKSQGADGLQYSHTNKQWSKETKAAAVAEYLSGKGALWDICKKYEISSHGILQSWIKVYNNSHKELKSTCSGGRKPMTKGRKTTFDERLAITQHCIANSRNYGASMDKYNVSYQQIYLWVKKYDEKGVNGLLDRRGKAKPECELTEADRLRAENKMLEAKNIELEMENRLLKKLQEVERRRR